MSEHINVYRNVTEYGPFSSKNVVKNIRCAKLANKMYLNIHTCKNVSVYMRRPMFSINVKFPKMW